ncbi:hypothetical protein LDENG_00119740 [Lucifuga dentata]|nr:hypothetical protein LDENG_00119740 [Lucifuga dentata]
MMLTAEPKVFLRVKTNILAPPHTPPCETHVLHPTSPTSSWYNDERPVAAPRHANATSTHTGVLHTQRLSELIYQ